MRKGSIFISIALIIILNLSSQIIWGNRGLLAQRELERNLQELESHLTKLERYNHILQDRLVQLQENPELVSDEAGRLRYIQENEVLVFVRNWNTFKAYNSPEDILHMELPEMNSGKGRIRIFSLLAGMILCLLLTFVPVRQENKAGEKNKGISHIL